LRWTRWQRCEVGLQCGNHPWSDRRSSVQSDRTRHTRPTPLPAQALRQAICSAPLPRATAARTGALLHLAKDGGSLPRHARFAAARVTTSQIQYFPPAADSLRCPQADDREEEGAQ
jgi:hypothetical protein